MHQALIAVTVNAPVSWIELTSRFGLETSTLRGIGLLFVIDSSRCKTAPFGAGSEIQCVFQDINPNLALNYSSYECSVVLTDATLSNQTTETFGSQVTVAFDVRWQSQQEM